MREGMNFESILFYRFLFACLALGCILLLDKQSFHIKRKEIPSLMLLAFLYLMSAVFLFWGYKFMASGVATTIHFMYPVLTTLIMMIFFREGNRRGASLLSPSHGGRCSLASLMATVREELPPSDYLSSSCRLWDMHFIWLRSASSKSDR